MNRLSSGPSLTTVFVDYDNIYLSLKRKNDEAAKRFAKDSGVWLQAILSGELITTTSSLPPVAERRVVMSRCYGNPVPRRNSNDNSTDMNSFPFIRHHFLKSGFEVIDCPPLTAQLKNSADIRIVMDIRDILTHDTFFDEFIIMSGDADFTPVLHRLRAHARRTVVFANDSTAQPYTAISDGEIRESSLIQVLMRGASPAQITTGADASTRELAAPQRMPVVDVEAARAAILSEVVGFVRNAPQAVPLETLADRAVRLVGHERTVGTQWGGYGSFRDLLLATLPDDIHLSDTPPYTVFDANRHINAAGLIAPQPQLPAPVATPERNDAERREAPRADYTARDTRDYAAPRGYQGQPDRLNEARAMDNRAIEPRAESRPVETRPVEAPRTADMRPADSRIDQRFSDYPQAPAAQATTPAYQPTQQQPAGQLQAHQPRRSDALPPLSARPVDPAFPRQQTAAYAPSTQPQTTAQAPIATQMAPSQMAPAQPQPEMRREPVRTAAPAPAAPAPAARTADQATQIQQSIARIHEACQAPALAPAEYRVLFEVMAQELTNNGLQGAQTLANITQRAREFGLDLKRDDLRFILEVVSESDPWFEQGASANLFAGRFRNFVVARCRSQGLNLSADELDLVDAWFSSQGSQAPANRAAPYGRQAQPAAAQPQQSPAAAPAQPAAQTQAQPVASTGTMGRDYTPQSDRWWSLEEGRQHIAEQRSQSAYGNAPEQDDEFPRIVRSRLRG